MKNLIRRTSRFQSVSLKSFIYCFLLIFLSDCQQPSELPIPQVPADNLSTSSILPISIEEAKVWFENTYQTSSSPNLRVTKNDKKSPLWNFAKQSEFKKGDKMVIVPLASEKDEKISAFFNDLDNKNEPETWEQNQILIKNLLIFKNKKAKNTAVIMYLIPSEQYKKSHTSINGNDLTGMILFRHYDDEDKLLEGWRMENGQVTEVFGEQNGGETRKNGRMMGCVTVTYGHWKQVANLRVSGITGHFFLVWVVDHTETYCSGGDGGGGYFEGQLPSGSGGGGVNPSAITNVFYDNQYVTDFLNQYGGLFPGSFQQNHFYDNPHLVDAAREMISEFGNSIVTNYQELENKAANFFSGGSTLSVSEKNVLSNDGFYGLNLLAYAWNGIVARRVTTDIVREPDSGGCPFCRGNAFKHTLFAVFNSHTFGSYMASQLGDAHEAGLVGLETTMDKANNLAGYTMYDNFNPAATIPPRYWPLSQAKSVYIQKVNDMFGNGELIYIKTEAGNPPTLTPTNQ